MSRFSTTSSGRVVRSASGIERWPTVPRSSPTARWLRPVSHKTRLPAGNQVICTLRDPAVEALASELRTTRSAAAVELWRPHLAGAIVAIGNAPTALFHLLEIIAAGADPPSLVLGFPVGFVGAAEAKEALIGFGRSLPFVALRGRRGGSALAAAAVNALCARGGGMKSWLGIVGIGEDGVSGLAPAARALIETAELLVGGARHLAMVPPALVSPGAERLIWRRPFADTLGDIAAWRGRRVTVLASGDPLWYGVGTVLARRFPLDEMTIVPHSGAFSLAAARLGWAIEGCMALTLHGRPLDGLRLHLAPRARLLLLSQDGDTPRSVAALLSASGWGPSCLTVFEHLGGAREAVVCGTADLWGERRADDLNTIAIDCIPAPGAHPLSRLAGLPDDAFEHDGQLTKREVRAVTLARLAPLAGEMLWDVGAGSGSIAIEWKRAVSGGAAIAIESRRGPCRDDRAQCRATWGPGVARHRGPGSRGAGRSAAAGRHFHRRRHRRSRSAGRRVGGAASRRPARRQCRQYRRGADRARLVLAARRRADADRGQPRRKPRRASCLAAVDAGNTAFRGKAGLA